MRYLAFAAVGLALSSGAALAQEVAAGEASFRKCAPCHSIGPDAMNKVGPVLNGLEGRKSGSVEGFNYSDANKNSGLTWDEATLTQWLRSPRALVPGTRMTFAGISKDDDIANVIAYLKTFDPQGNAFAAAKQ